MEEILLLMYIRCLIQKLKDSEKGQGMVEYALIIAFVAAIAILVLSNEGLGGAVSSAFDNACSLITAANDKAAEISGGA